MTGVWRLVEATLEVIEEYIPGKDNDNHYVRERRRNHEQMSPSSPIVCAEYEIIDEQTASLMKICEGYSVKGCEEERKE